MCCVMVNLFEEYIVLWRLAFGAKKYTPIYNIYMYSCMNIYYFDWWS